MKPLTERRQCADENKRFSLSSPAPQRNQRGETVVVVLGVMYPSVVPQLVEANTHLDLVAVPPVVFTGKEVNVVFYDPLSASRNGDGVCQAAKYPSNSKGDGYLNRREAQKAVARDLALLSLGKRS